jgi:hypothetical protein
VKTLLQMKNRRIHRLRTGLKSVVPFTLCGVDPCRRGVRTEGVNAGQAEATCPDCLREAAKEEAAKKEAARLAALPPVDHAHVARGMLSELTRLFEVNLRGHFDFRPEGPDTVGIERVLERMHDLARRLNEYRAEHGLEVPR